MIALLCVKLFKRHLKTRNAASRLAGGEEIGGGTDDRRLADSKHKRTQTLSHPMECTCSQTYFARATCTRVGHLLKGCGGQLECVGSKCHAKANSCAH